MSDKQVENAVFYARELWAFKGSQVSFDDLPEVQLTAGGDAYVQAWIMVPRDKVGGE